METKTFNLPPLLIKIGKKEHLLKLKETGEIFFGTYKGYRKQEQEEINSIREKIKNNEEITAECFDLIKRDPLEGLEKKLEGFLNMRINNKGNSITIKNLPAKLNFFQNSYSHIYCLFGFAEIVHKDFQFDNRLRKFGDHALIFDSKIFLTAVANTLKSEFDFNYVSYYDQDELNPKLGPFAKRNQFSYQYEYRIAANLINNRLYIGSILKEANNSILIKYDDLNMMRLHIE